MADAIRPVPGAEHERYRAKQRRHGRHHDRPETYQACLVYGLPGVFPLFSFHIQGEVDHHNGVFLHDADQQDDPDQRHDAEIRLGYHERKDAPTPAEGNVDRMVIGWT